MEEGSWSYREWVTRPLLEKPEERRPLPPPSPPPPVSDVEGELRAEVSRLAAALREVSGERDRLAGELRQAASERSRLVEDAAEQQSRAAEQQEKAAERQAKLSADVASLERERDALASECERLQKRQRAATPPSAPSSIKTPELSRGAASLRAGTQVVALRGIEVDGAVVSPQARGVVLGGGNDLDVQFGDSVVSVSPDWVEEVSDVGKGGSALEDLMRLYDKQGNGALDENEYRMLCTDCNVAQVEAERFRSVAPGGRLDKNGLRALAGDVMTTERITAAKAAAAARLAAASVSTSDALCTAKAGSHGATTRTTCDLQGISDRMQRIWREAEGDICDELVANLIAPPGVDSKIPFAEVSRALEARTGSAGRNRAELLAMTLYTMAGPDIDALMCFPGVPTYGGSDSERAAWQEYCDKHSSGRNGAVFSSINWAMRTVGAAEDNSAAWDTVRRWIKTICLLCALCQTTERQAADELSRGLAGLPQPVVDAHAALQPGGRLDWPAPTSSAVDPRVAEEYVAGAAANATGAAGGTALFKIQGLRWGLPLQHVSKYPNEAEVLIAPLTTFTVQSVERGDGPLRITLAKEEDTASGLPESFVEEVLRDAAAASHRLICRNESSSPQAAPRAYPHKPRAPNNRPWMPTSSLPGFRSPPPIRSTSPPSDDRRSALSRTHNFYAVPPPILQSRLQFPHHATR